MCSHRAVSLGAVLSSLLLFACGGQEPPTAPDLSDTSQEQGDEQEFDRSMSSVGKKCGPFAGGGCAADEVCNKLSCGAALGVGVSGTCVKRPLPKKCPTTKAPVCGCDGLTYGNDCMRIRAGAALWRKGACTNPKCGYSGQCPAGWICNITEYSTGAPIDSSRCIPKPKSCPTVSIPYCGGEPCFSGVRNFTNDCYRLLAHWPFGHTGRCTASEITGKACVEGFVGEPAGCASNKDCTAPGLNYRCVKGHCVK